MIVVAIVTVLAAIALSAYQDYAIRSRKLEGLLLAGDARSLVVENASRGARDLGFGYYGPEDGGTRNVLAVTVVPDSGIITIEMTSASGGGRLLLTPTSGGASLVAGTVPENVIDWTCTGSGPRSQLPSECR